MTKLLFSRYRLWAGTALSILFLYLSFRGIEWSQTYEIVFRANWALVLTAVITVLMTAAAKAGRWWLLFYPHQGALRYRRLLSILLIGQMVNIVVPARLGEAARLYLIGEVERVSRARTLGTIALEKLIDLLMVPVMLAMLIFLMPLPSWVQRSGAQTLVVGVAMAATVVVGLAQHRRAIRLTTWGLGWLPTELSNRIIRQLELGFRGVQVLRHPGISPLLVGGSVGIWVLSAVTNYLVFLALDLKLPFSAAVFLLIVLQLGVAVPSTPGKLGVFHYLCILGLSVFGVARAPALGYALLLYAVVFIPISVAGAVGLWWENLNIRRVQTLGLEREL